VINEAYGLAGNYNNQNPNTKVESNITNLLSRRNGSNRLYNETILIQITQNIQKEIAESSEFMDAEYNLWILDHTRGCHAH